MPARIAGACGLLAFVTFNGIYKQVGANLTGHGGRRMRSFDPRGNIYEFAEGLRRNRTRSPRSRFQIAQRQHLEDERAAQLAAAIGTTLYDSRAMRL